MVRLKSANKKAFCYSAALLTWLESKIFYSFVFKALGPISNLRVISKSMFNLYLSNSRNVCRNHFSLVVGSAVCSLLKSLLNKFLRRLTKFKLQQLNFILTNTTSPSTYLSYIATRCLRVCLSSISSGTAGPIRLNFFLLAPSWSRDGFRPKKFRIQKNRFWREIVKYFFKNIQIFM